MSITELKTELADREAAYRLLSACYYQPCPEWGEAQLLPNLAGLCARVSPQAGSAAEALKKAWSVADIEGLTVEYARLFVGPMALQAAPYGSVYLEHDRRVMGESTLAVMRFYRESGLSLEADFSEMPDHIAVELEFVSYLLQQAAADSTQAGAAQWLGRAGIFRDSYLATWCGRFCQALRSNAESPFYRALADLTDQIVSTPFPSPAA